MIKYYHLLMFGRSKVLETSNKKWFYQSVIRSHHLLSHPQPQPQPQPPPPYPFIFRNTRVDTTITSISQYGRNHHHARLSTLHNLELPDHHEGGYALDYQVSIKDRDVICANHEPKIEYYLPQSNLDLLLPPLVAGVFFCYTKKDDTLMSPEIVVKNMKNSLAGVLSTFYPLAGEIIPNSQGEPEVLCNNNGVEFIHAHADVEMKTIDFHHPDATVKEKLVPKINFGVISLQVTEFSCGAIVVSCAFDHRIGDAGSMDKFLIAWAEYARHKKISYIPSFRPSILNPRRPPHYNTMFDNMYLPILSLPPPPPIEEKLHSRIFYIRSESINHFQSEASSKETRRSKFQSFTAFMWKILNTTSRMGIVVNGRKYLSGNNEKESSMIQNHFANILSVPYGVLNNHNLREMQLNEVANKVNEFVTEATRDEHFRGLIDWVELHRPEPVAARVYFKLQENDGDAIVVSSGQGLPINDMNFGWGPSDFGTYYFPWGGQTGYITTMPSSKKNGDWIVYAYLKQKHLDLIESEAQHVLNPITDSYLRF